MVERVDRPPAGRGLATRILVLAIFFVLIGEVLIYVPSISRFRVDYLEQRLAAAHLATLSLDVLPGESIDANLEAALLDQAGIKAVTLWRNEAQLMLGQVLAVEAVFDLGDRSPLSLIYDALVLLVDPEPGIVRVLGPTKFEPGATVDVILDQRQLHDQMLDYSVRILSLSIFLSMLVALLLVVSLRRMIVWPLGQLTKQLEHFRQRPEDLSADPQPSHRLDEFGIVERELARMQRDLRQALGQKTRLAALGAAVSQLTHDLKNMLASAVLISDRLEASADPAVRQVAPTLIASLDRAVRLCVDTLAFARDRPRPPKLEAFPLSPLVEEAALSAGLTGSDFALLNDIRPDFTVCADRDQLFRVLLNLLRNSREAMADRGGEIRCRARKQSELALIEIADNGPGIPHHFEASLFETFGTSGKVDGSGLGLAICREIMRAHGGEIELRETGATGTSFALKLPVRHE